MTLIGALAFSAPAWRLAARDESSGWDDAARQANLQRVVCNSRFLIRPGVRVPELASEALARCLRRLPRNWEVRHGEAPVLLETFIDRSRRCALDEGDLRLPPDTGLAPALRRGPRPAGGAVRLLAHLDGFLGREGDGEPGTQSVWRGLQRLDAITVMYRELTRVLRPSRGPP